MSRYMKTMTETRHTQSSPSMGQANMRHHDCRYDRYMPSKRTSPAQVLDPAFSVDVSTSRTGFFDCKDPACRPLLVSALQVAFLFRSEPLLSALFTRQGLIQRGFYLPKCCTGLTRDHEMWRPKPHKAVFAARLKPNVLAFTIQRFKFLKPKLEQVIQLIQYTA